MARNGNILAAAFKGGSPLLLTLLALPAGCASLEPPPPTPQTVIIRVSSDPGRPLKDAAILFGGKKIGATGSDGAAEIQIAGKDGEAFEVMITCPKGFESPNKPVRMAFRRLADPSKKPEYEVQCPPKTRTVVVAVRADGAADMPVMLRGVEVARTDESGAAHVALTLEPGHQFLLKLDTRDERFASYHPQNPVQSFDIGHQDDIFTFDQKFDYEKKPRVIYRGPRKPTGPIMIPSAH